MLKLNESETIFVYFKTDAVSSLEVEDDIYTMEDDPRLKKLSAWRVFIPQVMMRMDQNCKYYHTFRIEVQRIDVRDEGIFFLLLLC